MKTETLRDRYGKRLGTIETTGEKSVLRNEVGRRLGEYNSKDNFTRDNLNRKVGVGNLLTKLLP